ncbi:MAG TPA: DUF4878 domain-containing protein [Spirochaetota bacterium]|nr:DUF4878 domain-containing protein [Spirochaetota bacterium]
MRRTFIFLAIATLGVALACGGGRPSDVLKAMQKVYSSDKFDDANKYYTKGTVELLNELNKLNPKSTKEESLADKKFVSGAKWKVIEEKTDGESARVKVRYVEHPVENMKGYEHTYKMKKEDGVWKIDMEDDLKGALSLMKNMGALSGFAERLKKAAR